VRSTVNFPSCKRLSGLVESERTHLLPHPAVAVPAGLLMNEQDLLEFVQEDESSQTATAAVAPPWRILVVDDDEGVHESTRFGLRGLLIEDRPVQLLHAHSAAGAMEVLLRETDIAVVLLDVVMEAGDSGLALVARIRGELGLANLRIVLRTGQPGHAPEIETIQRYDINDYKTKSELTRAKLFTSLTTAVRAYDQLQRLQASGRGLELVVQAGNRMLAEQDLASFAHGVLVEFSALAGTAPEGLVCTVRRDASAPALPRCAVLAAAGCYTGLPGDGVETLAGDPAASALERAVSERRSVIGQGHFTLYLPGRNGQDLVAFLRGDLSRLGVNARLLDVFSANLALKASNLEMMSRLRAFAFVDRLLSLPNRLAMVQQIDRDNASGRAVGRVLALLDIDRFAEINDMFGHSYGDLLLAAIARRLHDGLPGDCQLARVAGDTFGVWGCGAVVEAEHLAALLEQPFEINGVAQPVSLSMGLVRWQRASDTGLELAKNASIALKQAKASGQGGAQYYTAEVGVATRERTRLLHGLRQAVERHELAVVYQPQLELAGGRVIGAEALLRWRRADGQFVSPADFIPVAEQSGLIVPIGLWVLRTALGALAWLRASGNPLRMAVNVSPLQFAQPQFLAQLDEVLAEAQLPPECLELEITESAAVMGVERVAALLRQVKARGIAVAIDDFGTGFSSLSYLDRLPADRLKIDRAFVSALDSGRAGARIAEMIVPLGRRLGMQVLAEGVETQTQAEVLRQMGCDEVQGYLYGRPMAFDALVDWLAARRAPEP
jgi:diguanylate cyclase (GGDEF)-like protein